MQDSLGSLDEGLGDNIHRELLCCLDVIARVFPAAACHRIGIRLSALHPPGHAQGAQRTDARHGEGEKDDGRLVSSRLKVREGREIGRAVLIEGATEANRAGHNASDHELVCEVVTHTISNESASAY